MIIPLVALFIVADVSHAQWYTQPEGKCFTNKDCTGKFLKHKGGERDGKPKTVDGETCGCKGGFSLQFEFEEDEERDGNDKDDTPFVKKICCMEIKYVPVNSYKYHIVCCLPIPVLTPECLSILPTNQMEAHLRT